MKLNKQQFCTAVDTYKSMLEEEDELINVLDICPEWKPGTWIQNYYELLAELCELEDYEYIGTDLDWFCFETNFGRRKDMCKVYDHETGLSWNITDPEILYDFITR